MPKTGRPRALDEGKRREICALISAGCGILQAAKYVDCSASTIRREARRNPEFDEALRRAFLSVELSPLHAIRQAAHTHWRAAAWFLERTNPQRFAKQNVRYLKPEQLREFISALADVLVDQTNDPELERRIIDQFRQIADTAERESLAAQLDLPDPPRPRFRPSKAPPKPGWYKRAETFDENSDAEDQST